MLLEFGFKNFYSFKEWGKLSFALPKNAAKEISKGKSYTPVLCIKGKNASGKTNILRGVHFLASFCTDSFRKDPQDSLSFENFYENDDATEFYIEFLIDDVLWIYELDLTKTEVLKEVLYKKVKRKSKVVERVKGTFTIAAGGFEVLKLMKLRKNASFISTARQYDFEGLAELDSIFNFFDGFLTNVGGYGSFFDLDVIDINTASQFYYKNKDALKVVTDLLISFDTGIHNITILEHEDSESNIKKYIPVFEHLADGKVQGISHYTESKGTIELFKQLLTYFYILKSGGIFCLDEFDIHLHPLILPKLLELFLDESFNTTNAQMIFTTHDSDTLELMGKYRTYLVDKIENESYNYRLDQLPNEIIRNDRAILPLYKAGKLGGIPRL